ncbi:MAG: hypothetical protein JXR52_02810 [Bacteroidales bacterium]|nr:hypothetical protein [Bacteroidales bacterium]MBN2697731.1 hypothetical protein [Bacteroidales bacterium]
MRKIDTFEVMRTLLISIWCIIIFSVTGTFEVTAQEPAMFRLAGFAAMGDGTTGGGGGDTVTVTTGTGLQEALKAKQDSQNPLTIFVEGTITLENSPGLSKIDIKEVRDVSVIGKDEGAEFDGIGLKIWKAGNIILRNLKVHHVVEGEGDCISIEGPADHIWVDHCELYNEFPDVDKDYYDGLLDAKRDAEYLTYSWNFLHDSWKTALVGSSESDIYDRKLTMHHNYFLNCNSRIPLFRASTGHFFNNYYKDIASTAINSRINACVLIENNYFENANNPWVWAYSDIPGGGHAVGNILVNSPFIYSDDTHELPECDPEIPYEYQDLLHDAEAVPDLVITRAGTGKLETGSASVPGHVAKNLSFSVWPNPVGDIGRIHWSAFCPGELTVTLIAADGTRHILPGPVVDGPGTGSLVFDASSFSSGIYLLELRQGEKRYVEKILMMH